MAVLATLQPCNQRLRFDHLSVNYWGSDVSSDLLFLFVSDEHSHGFAVCLRCQIASCSEERTSDGRNLYLARHFNLLARSIRLKKSKK
jgi:hypothetical protein